MKYIKMLCGDELKKYIGSLWKNQEIKESYESKQGPIWDLVTNISNYPLFFYEQSHPVERSQFSSWWRHIQLREYFNPSVTDLYYLHEFAHISNRIYIKDGSFEQFKQNSIANEFFASVFSEVMIYLYFPTLRKKTFDFEIWADRFIRLGLEPTQDLINVIINCRKNAMNTPNVNDPIEMYIHKYTQQNEVWFETWKNSFNKIDNAMFEFIDGNFTHTNFNNVACYELQKFLLENSKNDVIFYDETNAFNDYVKDSIITIHKT